jgi:SAM-dependent methyltransferase
MQKTKHDFLTDIADYYSSKLLKHGKTPQGVDWNGEENQLLRFQQLCKIIDTNDHFSINDLGCGYGALYDFLSHQYDSFIYSGFDISENMIVSAQNRNQGGNKARFVFSNGPDQVADYGVASGIFNVRIKCSNSKWLSYIKTTLDTLDRTSRKGFAFNCLTSYSDADKMRDYLYYANPCALFNHCKNNYSRNVALLHDYTLYEFTLLVRKLP